MELDNLLRKFLLCALIYLKTLAIQKSNPFVSFETVAIWFKIFKEQMKQKIKHNFNRIIKRNFWLISLALFPIK